MLNIALFGPPGAGKGTQSEFLIKKHNLFYISTGDLLRSEIAEKTNLGLEAESIIASGGLVSDEIIVQIIEKKIESNKQKDGFIFDGFPRTFVQAYILEGLLLKLHTNLTSLFSLEVPNEESTKRLLARAATSGRADDNEEVIKTRLQEYENKTLPVLDFYRERGKYVPIDGVGEIDAIFKRLTSSIDESLKKKRLNIIMLGYPGSGRGTQAMMLAKKFDLNYISTGDLLFEEVNKGTKTGNIVKGYVENGDNVPDEIVIKLLEKHIQKNNDTRGFIFKGFPRTIVQAYILDGLLKKQGTSVSCIIDLEVPMLQLIRRIVARGKKENRVSYKTNTESIIDRLESHEVITLPVLEYYQKDRKVITIDGTGEKDEIFEKLSQVVDEAFKQAR